MGTTAQEEVEFAHEEGPSYELFLSHSHADAELILRIAGQLDQLGIKCFLDQWDLGPGEGVNELAQALRASGAVAVFISGKPVGAWHSEEARQALAQAIEGDKRVFYVWLPGSNPSLLPPKMPEWLLARGRVVVQELPGGGLADHDLALLIAGARRLTPRAATGLLAGWRKEDED